MLKEAEVRRITGSTKVAFIVGDPIYQVKTPELINRYLDEVLVNAVIVPIHVSADQLQMLIKGSKAIRNLAGIIVTIPHKVAIANLCDAIDQSATASGAVNVIRRESDGKLVGGNFDGSGFVEGLKAYCGDVKGSTIFMKGAGGVARAIACALAAAGAATIIVANRTEAAADNLVTILRQWFPDVTARVGDVPGEDVDIAINATSLGMKPDDPLPFPVTGLRKGAAVAEVIMHPHITPLLDAAEQRGLVVVPGVEMLHAQIKPLAAFLRLTSWE
jgi:shikimate dehydrogenase